MRALIAAGLFALGLGAGLASVMVHQWWWGLTVALGAVGATLVALPGGWWRRLPFALGWSGAVAVLAGERAEGDYLVSTDTNGWLLLIAAGVVVVAGMIGLLSPRAAVRNSADDSGVQGPSP